MKQTKQEIYDRLKYVVDESNKALSEFEKSNWNNAIDHLINSIAAATVAKQGIDDLTKEGNKP